MTEKSYGVLNVEQLVERIEVRARVAEIGDRDDEAWVWREVAKMLRSIEFVGWKQLREDDRE